MRPVVIDTGAVQGVAEAGVLSFKGIPYAAPPIGALRWRPPQPAPAWTGLRQADRFGAICPQNAVANDPGVGKEVPGEDCLTLNLWLPEARPAAALPVMVWIHGGGFVQGSGSAPITDGKALARRGVIVVTFNYRLGRFGFFAHPALAAERVGANFGLMDQIAVLHWVRRNIAAFGGDPGNVTLFGESAGGMSINYLMLAPEARGLFAKAVVQSGFGREQPPDRAAAERRGLEFAAAAGAETAEALRALPAATILGEVDMAGNRRLDIGPILDGDLVRQPVDIGFRAGLAAAIPYVVGGNSGEISPGRFADLAAGLILADAKRAAGIGAAYAGLDKREAAAAISGDALVLEPARFLARQMAATGMPVYLYRFSYVAEVLRETVSAAAHASEIGYIFDTLDAPSEADRRMASVIGDYWANFAGAGDPNGAPLPAWPRYRAEDDRLLDFTGTGPTAGPDPIAVRLDAVAPA